MPVRRGRPCVDDDAIQTPPNGITTTHGYDDADRLVEARYYPTGERFEYAYDAVGNRMAMTETLPLDGTTVTTYTYDAADRLLVSGSAGHQVSYGWDDRGNLTSNGTFTYTYDSAGRMVEAESITTTLVYTYNGDGLRVARSDGSQNTTYAWDLASGLPQVLNDGDTLYVPGVGQWDGDEWTYNLADGLGSVRQVVDAGGCIVRRYTYSPFGRVLAAQGTRGSALQYAGEHWDGDAGLLYLRARWYDPATGRFLTRDPFPGFAALPQTQHAYVYVGNNPVNLTDPNGQIAPILIAAGVGLAIGAVGGGASYVLANPGGRPEDYLHDRYFWNTVGSGAFSSGMAGLATGAVVPLLPVASGALSAIGIGAGLGALGGDVSQIAANVINPHARRD
jgi:RHS repeat-associated protein